MSQLSVGIAGLGYWGPSLLRNFRSLAGCRIAAMADTDPVRLEEMSRLYPDVRAHPSAEALIDDEEVEAVVLALPANLLPDLGVRALERGRHVLIEKPMAASLEDGRRMAKVASAGERLAMVDFTFVYSPAVRWLKQALADEELGRLQYYQSTRINLGRFQSDIDVIWDLAVHDVSILAFLLGRDPVEVLATGRSLGGNGHVDTAHVTLVYEDGFQAFLQVSWMAPMKVRTALLAGSLGMVIYDDVAPDEKIRLYQVQRRFEPGREDAIVPTFRLGNVLIPRLPSEEPLRNVAATFVEAALAGAPVPTDWEFGLRVLATVDAARRSLETHEVAPVVGEVPS